ncbi:MAG: hypothetical protein ABIC40_05965, partial [bacterium]
MQETQPIFQSRAEIEFPPGIDQSNMESGADVPLVVKFFDFLGEPTSDTGPITLSVSKGILRIPKSGLSGSTITIDESGLSAIEHGEIHFVLETGDVSGAVIVSLECKLGSVEKIFRVRKRLD